MIRTAEASLPPREHVTTAGSVKSLVAVVMLVATILMVLFDSAALITVWRGPIVYPGIQFTTRGSDVLIAEVTDPAVSRLGVRAGQAIGWQGRSKWRAAWPHAGDTITVATPSGPVVLRAQHQAMTTAPMIVAFASNRNGSTIDPEERRLLRRLCAAAAVAYDAVALAETRQELAALKSRDASSSGQRAPV